MSIHLIDEALRQLGGEELEKAFRAIGGCDGKEMFPAVSVEDINNHFRKDAETLKRNWNHIETVCDKLSLDCSKLRAAIE